MSILDFNNEGKEYNQVEVGYDAASKKITVELNYKFVVIDDPKEAAIVYDKQNGKYIAAYKIPIEDITNVPDRYIIYTHRITGNITILNPLGPLFDYNSYIMCFTQILNNNNTHPEPILTSNLILEFAESEYDQMTANLYLPSLDELKAMLGGGANGK